MILGMKMTVQPDVQEVVEVRRWNGLTSSIMGDGYRPYANCGSWAVPSDEK
jgi:hypothetical protein